MSARPLSKREIVVASSRSMVTCTSTSKPRPIAAGSMTARYPRIALVRSSSRSRRWHGATLSATRWASSVTVSRPSAWSSARIFLSTVSIGTIIARSARVRHKHAIMLGRCQRSFAGMADLLSYAPVAATVFAVPQFAPQIRRLAATGDTAGVSWSWAALTCVNNAAWIAYFALARYWMALIPSIAVAVLAGILAIMLTGRVRVGSRPLILIAAWIAALV